MAATAGCGCHVMPLLTCGSARSVVHGFLKNEILRVQL
jgi:hypothetical protein